MEFSPDGEHLGSVGESICIWDASITPELRRRRSVNLFVVNLFRKLGLRADVLERLKNMPSLSASRRREAIDAAQRCPENPLILDALAWQLVEKSDGAMSDYRKAVLFSEEACMLEPEKAMYRITLGAAYFRARNYSKALDTLDRANRIKLGEAQTIDAKGLAFLAMTHHQLGRVKEAHSELERLRERINDPRSAAGGKARRLLTEAESLLAAPGSPGGK
jgi:tetratricopeptide (TPR) repeat protein